MKINNFFLVFFFVFILSSCNKYIGPIEPNYKPKNTISDIFLKDTSYIEVENLSITKITHPKHIDKNTNLTFTLDDGTVIPCDDAEGRMNLIKAVPGIMGAHAGCNWEARRQCHKDVVSFFKKEFLNS